MNENRDLGFCPRCGALMQDGTCRSCGYTAHRMQPSSGQMQAGGVQGSREQGPYYRPPYAQPPQKKKKSSGLIAALIIGGILAFLILLMVLIFCLDMILSRTQERNDPYYEDGGYEDEYDEYGDYYEDDYEYYEPSESDAYYEEIVDCTRTDLDYGIDWVTNSITPDDSDDSRTFYATYPCLTREDGAYDGINEQIRTEALQYQASYREYEGGCLSSGYVTYMDETKISVVFQHELYREYGPLPRLTALTFDLESGSLIEPEQMTEIDEELVLRFRAQDKTQNGGVEYVKNCSDEELLSILKDKDSAVYFYTPVGLECGFNYDGQEDGIGWVTVTLKDLAL